VKTGRKKARLRRSPPAAESCDSHLEEQPLFPAQIPLSLSKTLADSIDIYDVLRQIVSDRHLWPLPFLTMSAILLTEMCLT